MEGDTGGAQLLLWPQRRVMWPQGDGRRQQSLWVLQGWGEARETCWWDILPRELEMNGSLAQHPQHVLPSLHFIDIS